MQFSQIIASAAIVVAATASPLDARASYTGVGCDNVGLDAGDVSNALNGLKSFCAKNPSKCRQTAYIKSGNAVAYFCDWRGSPKFDAGSLDNAINMITNECAKNQGGSYSDNNEDSRTYSYGITNWQTTTYCNIPAYSLGDSANPAST